ncbi:MAG: hypothetical protein R3E31_20690, partial [Chloroflexota bacterium]
MMTINSLKRDHDRLGLYLHIPFCIKKCRYCGFYSCENADENELSLYISRLKDEIRQAKETLETKRQLPKVDTIYFGGGTPSLLSAEKISSLL